MMTRRTAVPALSLPTRPAWSRPGSARGRPGRLADPHRRRPRLLRRDRVPLRRRTRCRCTGTLAGIITWLAVRRPRRHRARRPAG